MEIQPTFSEDVVKALTGDLGPFTAGVPAVRAVGSGCASPCACGAAVLSYAFRASPLLPPPCSPAGGAAVGGAAAQGRSALPRDATSMDDG